MEVGETGETALSSEVLEKLTKAKTMIHSSFGQVVLAMSSVPVTVTNRWLISRIW